MQDTTTANISATLEQVGPRLIRLRTHPITLIGVAAATGISTSTLSLSETAQRRRMRELLLALWRAYVVSLDDLVAAAEEGDPRLRRKPGRVEGRTVIPLTRLPDGAQAWKVLIRSSLAALQRRTHDGHEWIDVLCGHMRVVLGDQELVLASGDVA